MCLYKSIACEKYHAIAAAISGLGLLFVVCGCSILPAKQKEASYHNPPKVQSILQPRNGRVLCKERSSATAMALTGFFADGCVRLLEADRWRVVSISFNDLGKGQTLWLVGLRDSKNHDSNTFWAPLPWHDWA